MTKKMRKITLWVLLLILSIIYISESQRIDVNAVISTDENAPYELATKEIPNGINPKSYLQLGELDDLDEPGIWTVTYAPHNTVKFNSSMDLNNNIVRITRAANINLSDMRTIGTVWSRDNAKFTYTQKQVIELWLYFTDTTSFPGARSPGDGMAFALQNDTRGVNAAASFKVEDNLESNKNSNHYQKHSFDFGPMGGQTLGVYGTKRENAAKNDTNNGKTTTIVDNAVKNSWALEFDTKLNTSSANTSPLAWAVNADGNLPGMLSNSFDAGQIASEHIAAVYPGDDNYYIDRTSNGNHYFTLRHDQIMAANLTNKGNDNPANNNWHHLTLTWSGAAIGGTGTMKMSFNDKNIDGTSIPSSDPDYQSNSYEIDTSKIDPQNLGTARWGVTGSTSNGSKAENLVMIDSAPSAVKGSAANTLENSHSQLIPDKSQVADAGSILTQTYKVSYDNMAASSSWDNIIAKLPIPAGTTLVNDLNNASKIKYSDGQEENITETVGTDGFLQHKLQRSLSKDLTSATITLYLQAADSEQDVNFSQADFSGTQYSAHTTAPSFSIIRANKITVTPSKNSIGPFSIASNGEASRVIDGTYVYTNADGIAITNAPNSSFTMHTNLNGRDLPSYVVGDSQTFNSYSLDSKQYVASELNDGQANVLKYYITDGKGAVSNEITVQFFVVSGELQLDTSGKSNFIDGKVNGTEQTLERDTSGDNWHVQVIDGRTTEESKWSLSINASKLKEGERELKGDITYKGDSITNINTLIASGRTLGPGSDHTVNIDSSDIALRVNANATKGTYKGEITWTLTDTPN